MILFIRYFFHLLHNDLTPIDSELIQLAEKSDFSNPYWKEHHNKKVYVGLSNKIKDALRALATNFGYVEKTSEPA